MRALGYPHYPQHLVEMNRSVDFFQVAIADVFIIVIEKTSDEIKICPARISLCRVSSLSACTSSAGSFLL